MKKIALFLAAMLIFTGCANTADKGTEQNSGTNEKTAVEVKNPEEVFTEGDFTMYAENGMAILSLGMKKETAEDRLKSFKEEIGDFKVTYSDHVIAKPNQDSVKETLVNYISYEGYRTPVYTSKGIYTMGNYGKAENCSSAEDVIDKYDIDTENESYIANKNDENNYCIELLYDSNNERIITPKDTELSKGEAQKMIRFLINDGVVKGIDYYQYSWE